MNKKSTAAVMLTLLLVLLLSSCGTAAPAATMSGAAAASSDAVSLSAAGQTGETTASTILVVYFSATGTTKSVAQKLAAQAGADLFEIVPEKPYTSSDLDYNDNSSRSTLEMKDATSRPGIAGGQISLDGYDTVFIGYPIWWGEAPRILSTFIEGRDLSGKTIIPFCTSSVSGIADSGAKLAGLASGGNWLEGRRFDANTTQAELAEWVKGLGIA